jgi:hypothetical protein
MSNIEASDPVMMMLQFVAVSDDADDGASTDTECSGFIPTVGKLALRVLDVMRLFDGQSVFRVWARRMR